MVSEIPPRVLPQEQGEDKCVEEEMMQLRNRTELKKHKHLLNKEIKLIKDFVQGKYDVKAYIKRSDKLGKQILSLSSVTLENFEKTMRRPPMSNLNNLERSIEHEREHAEVNEKYGIPCVYAIIIREKFREGNLIHYEIQPYVQEFLHEKAKTWSKEKMIKCLKEVFITGTKDEKLGERDREVVKILNSFKG